MKGTRSSEIPDLLPGIGAPATRALAAAGITRLVQLTSLTEVQLLKLHGVGPKAIRLLREAISKRRLQFARPGDLRSGSEAGDVRMPRRPRR